MASLAIVVKKRQAARMSLYDEFCGVEEGAGRMFPGEWRGGDTQLTLDR